MSNVITPGIDSMLDSFYKGATIFVPNKYSVILYGPAVRNAVSVLRKSAQKRRVLSDPKQGDGSYGHREVDSVAFDRWAENHYDPDFTAVLSQHGPNGRPIMAKGAVHLKWACSSVNIPTLDTQESDDRIIMDTFKNIKFHIIGGFDANGQLTMDVTEEKGLMWYQFFNALSNQFFNAKALIPRDSLHKLSAQIVPLITTEGVTENKEMKYEKGQIFEFNSITYAGMGQQLKLSNDSTSPLKYNVSFVCPNPFQSTFKKDTKGMINRANDATNIKPGQRKFNPSVLEDNRNDTYLDIWD